MMKSNGGCKCGCGLKKAAKILLVVGGLNWGLVGLGMLLGSDLNLVNMIFGSWPMVEAVVYLVVGVSAVIKLFGCPCAKCKAGCATCNVSSTSSSSAMGNSNM